MDAAILQTVNIQLPSSDMKFLKELGKKMGGTAKKVKSAKKISEWYKAIEDVKNGNVMEFDSVKDMMDYLNS